MSRMTDYTEQLVVNHFLRGQSHTPAAAIYAALCTSATDDAGGGTEATGGSYVRKAITLAAPSGGQAANSAALTWTNLAAGTYTHMKIIDALSGGNVMWHGPLSAAKTITAGRGLTIPAGELVVGFTSGSHATAYFRHLIINRLLRNQAFSFPSNLYCLLADQDDAELAGGTYTRQVIDFAAPTGGATSNNSEVLHTGLPDVVDPDFITNAGVADAISAGNTWLYGPVTTPFEVASGDAARLPAGALSYTVR